MTSKAGPKFTGFSPAAMKFLRELAKNNERDWFVPRKHIYETELLAPLQALVSDVTDSLRRARIPIGADPTRSTFRIYRDVRFSPDKRPYKTNLGAYLPSDGTRDKPGGLYIHIQPKQSFAAIAFYELDKPVLQRWRSEMARNPKRFQTMLQALERNGLKLSVEHEALKRMPRGFESCADSPIARYFRLGSFTVGEDLTDKEVTSRQLVARVIDLAKRAKPLLDYGRNLS
ncbi:MAG TPA: TIGR02453 family protein [Candidatus Eremiobacteraceae bacterium]|nr:TIGR02453 family protein [Candidatus Eremiobacteraceae bacterium]